MLSVLFGLFFTSNNLDLVVHWTIERHESWIKTDKRPKTSRADKVKTYSERYVMGIVYEGSGVFCGDTSSESDYDSGFSK